MRLDELNLYKKVHRNKSWSATPPTIDIDIDDPKTTELRAYTIRDKVFLRKIYEEWYTEIVSNLPPIEGKVLELGSGAGFLKTFIPGCLTSEIFHSPGIDIVLDGCAIPFSDDSLRAIVMTDVFHHISRPKSFFEEALRCIRPSGMLIMIEPWVTPWSRWVYQNLHHEHFYPASKVWEFSSSGPLSGANIALPWIIFERDKAEFEYKYPKWKIISIKLMMPFRYIISGGLSPRNFMPGWSYNLWRSLEDILAPFMSLIAMFATIVIQKKTSIHDDMPIS